MTDMLLGIPQLRKLLLQAVLRRQEMGFDLNGLATEVTSAPDSYDALVALARRIEDAPWSRSAGWVEPIEWSAVESELAPDRLGDGLVDLGAEALGVKARAGFLASVCGCQLGKPLESQLTLHDIRAAAEPIGEWPIRDYISLAVTEALERKLGRRHPSFRSCCRETTQAAEPDDDITYTLLGMLMIEQHGTNFDRRHVAELWASRLTALSTWGPERRSIASLALSAACDEPDPVTGARLRFAPLYDLLVNGDVYCGAQIRCDGYGFAALGRPGLAARMAYHDARLNHEGTGLYASMFSAAMLSLSSCMSDRIRIAREALKFVPQRSRFFDAISRAITLVEQADSWQEAFSWIEAEFGSFGFCRVVQETATVINSFRFARDSGEGICIQVMQGLDTDSYAARVGSLCGVYFGPTGLEPRWLDPLNNTLHVGFTRFFDQDLSSVADRIGRLPAILAGKL
jgi:ADP-ribosylglycohydrolase